MRIDHHLSDTQLELAALRNDSMRQSGSMERTLLYQILHEAISRELTERQGRYLSDYYFESRSMEQIARQYGVNRSTVCRQLHAAQRRLETPLRYALLAQRGKQKNHNYL